MIAVYTIGSGIIILNIIILIVCIKNYNTPKIQQIQHSLSIFTDSFISNMQQIKDDSFKHSNHIASIISLNIKSINDMQKSQLEILSNQIMQMTQLNEIKLENIRKVLTESLHKIQVDNNLKLEQMRQTVEEKLHNTLEARLSESFKIVSERLEIVHRGLGEMQILANGVGDLKKVLTNIKVRGIWGEVQLDSLINQILVQEQYEKNVLVIPDAMSRVEYAIKLPGKDFEKPVWLPIDSKFPIEDFHRLIEAQESGHIEKIEHHAKLLESSIKACAKLIADKYIQPPYTTDFAIMFLPIETLYIEALKKTGLIEFLQREYKVIITSPTTLSAILNSLQMGFKTLAIEKRSSEVWNVLSAVKTEFLKFADILSKTKNKIDQASQVIGEVEVRTRAIQRKLKGVEYLDNTDLSNDLE